jgi:hypothetical protein
MLANSCTLRLDRVLNFLSSRPNWTPGPTPSQAHSLAVEGVGGSQFQQGDRHCGALGIYLLFACTAGL